MSTDSTLARALHEFLLEYLPRQRAASPHTQQSYRDTLKLLLAFIASGRRAPSQPDVEDLSVERVTAFLQHLEGVRHNRASTRNVRLAAIHSFFRYLGAHYPQHLAQAQRVLAIPFKRTVTREIHHLEFAEVQVLLAGIPRDSPAGRRDFTLLTMLFNTGARVSEIAGLQACDLRLAPPAHVLLHGKGRKERTCPLWPETARLVRTLLEEQGIDPHAPCHIFLNHRGHPLSRFGIRLILQKHVARTRDRLPSLHHKRIHPHSLRHSTAVHLLRAGVDLSTIAHWLGHASVNTTNKYLALDLEAKREALAKAKPLMRLNGKSGAWRKDASLIRWLAAL